MNSFCEWKIKVSNKTFKEYSLFFIIWIYKKCKAAWDKKWIQNCIVYICLELIPFDDKLSPTVPYFLSILNYNKLLIYKIYISTNKKKWSWKFHNKFAFLTEVGHIECLFLEICSWNIIIHEVRMRKFSWISFNRQKSLTLILISSLIDFLIFRIAHN